MSLPSVTVAVTTYNRAAYVARAAKSVLTQTYQGEIELIIVDDASTDDTQAALGKVRGALTHYYVNEVNRGIAYSKNRALILGTGELRGILDSDDYYEPTFIERCVEVLQAQPDVGCVYTDNYRCDAKGERIAMEPAGDWSLDTLLGCKLRGDCWLARWNVLTRTQLHDELFALEVDYDLFYQLHEVTAVQRIPQLLQTVTQHEGRTTEDRMAAAYWHAAGLGKYGHPVSWARRRAEAHPEWLDTIVEGYRFGESIAYRRQLKRILRVDDNTPERWARTWAEEDQSRLDVTLLADVLAWLPERCRFVDLGCGDGTLTRAIVAARPEVSGVGVDYVVCDQEVNTRFAWQVWDIREEWNVDPGRFDVVLCTEVIEHLQDPLRVLTVAHRLLRARGHLLLTTPLADDIKDTYHVWALRPADVLALVTLAGGRILHMQKTGAYGRRAVLYVIAWPD